MPQERISRRELARHLAAGSAVALTATASAAADDLRAEQPQDAPPAPGLTPVEAHMAWLLQRYPSEHLTDEQIEGIRRVVERRVAQSDALRQYPLDPADAPALVFAAFRGKD